ncbi:alkyl hydroperoxide reductase subunit F [Geothrix sp. PMB-07]|uniref:alkyl hydroperoxide reductase subunit F n=1 Tax=Geothrix sp. PMB-07 TaxID=3068640 RepID=UPI002740C9EE|nr:alkyl hydroperoxide reductase subunit F [Geothrix sp. PMB-07]WLT29974.1 alkyl hydroperoxide reductase subunit F [Geothrix sp. PMB-07]
MLTPDLRAQLQSAFQHLKSPVELQASVDDGAASAELRALLTEIAALSPQVTVRWDGAAERRPSFAVARPGEAARIGFAGVPLGHEFTSLALALLQVGGHPPRLAPELAQRIQGLPGERRFEVFVSLGCHNCPDVVQALNVLAVLNPGIQTVMVDGARFQAEAEARGILAVPAVFLDGEPFLQGRASLDEILAKLDDSAGQAAAEALAAKAPFDVLVVGGGPAGSAAAIYAARKGVRTGLVAERLGGQVLDTLGIENLISVKATEGPRLAQALEAHVREYDVDLMPLQRAEALLPEDGEGRLGLRLASGAVLRSRTLVLAPGARWRELNVPGEAAYRTKGVAYCPHCDGPLFKGKRVAVVGGGNSGVEAALDLAGLAAHVTLLEFDDTLRADGVLQDRLRSLPHAAILTGARTTEVLGDGRQVTGLTYEDRRTGEIRQIALDGIFVQIGLQPNTEWLKGALELTPRGEVVVDARGQTSRPGVFAAGDATTVPYKQIIIAMGEGAKASLGAFEHLLRQPVSG